MPKVQRTHGQKGGRSRCLRNRILRVPMWTRNQSPERCNRMPLSTSITFTVLNAGGATRIGGDLASRERGSRQYPPFFWGGIKVLQYGFFILSRYACPKEGNLTHQSTFLRFFVVIIPRKRKWLMHLTPQ